MVDFTLEVAGHPVGVSAVYESTKEYCQAYLSDWLPVFSIEITQADLALEREKWRREQQVEGLPVCELPDAYLEATAVQRKLAEQLFERNVIVFHGSVVAVDGQAFLFTAKSGTGKSTHTRFWRETFGDRAVMVNDDKPFLQMTDNQVMVYGSPWNGKHCLGANVCFPLKAICVLERGAENEIHQISGQDAIQMLFQQSNRPLDSRRMMLYMDLIDQLSKKTEFYRMHCNLDPDAARVAYEAMRK